MRILLTMALLAQLTAANVEPERRVAMTKAGNEIKTAQMKIASYAQAEKDAHDATVRTQGEKQKLIQQWKAKLGLDGTWSWSDEKGDWVQASH